MIEQVHVVPYGRPAGEALSSVVRVAKGADALAPVTVVVSSNFAGLAARRLLGSGILGGGIANVSFVTPYRLAELLGAERLLDRRPLTSPVLGAAVRLALASDPGPFAAVRHHVATQTALAAVYSELSNVSAPARARIATDGGRTGELAVRLHDAIAARLDRFQNEADLAHAATTHPDLAGRLAGFGHIVWYLPAPTTRPMSHLVAAVLVSAPSTVIVGSTGAPDADRAVARTVAVAGVDSGATPLDDRPHASEIVSVTDADEEVRAVVRRIVGLASSGVPLDRIGVFHPTPHSYVGMLEQQLAAAGIPANGPSRMRLRDTVAGRTLLAALALPAERWRRDRVMALVSGAPVRHGDGLATPSAWETISRQAGVVSGLADWSGKLAAFERTRARRLSHPFEEPSERQVELITRAIADATALRTFVAELDAAVGAVTQASGWGDKSDAALVLLDRLLGGTTARTRWPDPEQVALERVQDALTRLATLDELEPSPSSEVFGRALAAELDSTHGRAGRFGEGVLYGPLAAAVGLDLDAVFVLGCAEGLCPAARRDDAMLSDDARRLAGGELELRADRLHEQHRQFLAALATAPPTARVLTFPRSDLRGNRHLLPSRWLLDSAGELAGRVVHATDFPSLVTDGVTVVPSHASGVVTSPVHASVEERDLAVVAAWVHDGGRAVEHPSAAPVVRGLVAQAARQSTAFTEWDGNVGPGVIPSPASGRAWSPTRLQHWASCGFRYFLGDVLGLGERDEPERVLDLDPLDRGSALHRVLEQFIAEAIERGAPEPHEPWSDTDHERLREIAVTVFDEFESRGRTGRDLHWRLTHQTLLDTLDAFLVDDDRHRAATGARPEHVEFPFGDGVRPPVTIDLTEGRTLSFRGIADRIDRVDGDRLLVSDYKTGKGTEYRGIDSDDPVRGGTMLQLGLYAKAAGEQLSGSVVESHYWIVHDDPKVRTRHGYAWTDERDARLVEVVTAIVDGIDGGVFPAVPGDWNTFRNTHENCTYCPFDPVCPRDRGDHATNKIDAPQLAVRRALEWEAQ